MQIRNLKKKNYAHGWAQKQMNQTNYTTIPSKTKGKKKSTTKKQT